MKLAAALAVPLLALVLVTVVEVVKSSDEVRSSFFSGMLTAPDRCSSSYSRKEAP